MRETNDRAKNERMTAEIHALGDYNAFSRPKTSSVSKPLFLYNTLSFITSPYNMKTLYLYYDTLYIDNATANSITGSFSK